MRKLIILLGFILFTNACKKEESVNPCLNNIQDEIIQDIHYNKIFCSGIENFEWHYNSYDSYQNSQCSPNVPREIGFNGIVLAQGIKLPFVSEDENIKSAYNLSVELEKDTCLKTIDFHFRLENADTFERFEHNRNVIVLLNGIDSSYSVKFSHEIIPFKE
jgi:hypothetical protein